jgi:hypothetical protein
MITQETITLIAQLIHSQEEAAKELEKAIKSNDYGRINQIKQEILLFQKQISKTLENVH